MPSIADVIVAVKAKLAGVSVDFGKEFQEANEAPPRVVFIPRGDRFAPPAARANSPRSIHASVATRQVGLEARIWAAPDASTPESHAFVRATELLVDKVVLAIHEVCAGSYSLEDGEWGDTGHAQHGRLYILRFRVSVPVVPTDDNATISKTTWTDVSSPAGTPTVDALAATTTTVELATDVTGSPSP